jgi:hypothetical protein
MIDLNPIKCSNLKLDDIMRKIIHTIKQHDPQNKLLRITLEDIPSHIYRGIDHQIIRDLSSEAAHFEIKTDIVKDQNSKSNETSKIENLSNEFEIFIENQNIKEKKILLKLGLNYINKIESEEEK